LSAARPNASRPLVPRLNWARLNHVLIPSTKEGRDRFRNGRLARLVVGPLARTWLSLTDEGRGLLALSMAASLIGLDVAHGQNHLLWALCFSLLTASVAARPLLGLGGVRVDVEGPGRVAVGADARFRIRVANESERVHTGLRVQLPFLPWDGSWVGAERRIAALPAHGRVTAQATARFVERGHHHLDPFGVGALVPLGLATGPVRESRGTRFVVVPRILPVERLEWPDAPRHQRGGVALASRTGESSELAGLREWRDGDRLRDLHARSWARLGEPVVREYQQEYFSRVAVWLDRDAEGVAEERFERAVSLAAGIVEHLMHSEALIDLWTGADAAPPITLGRSLGGLDQALDALADVRSEGGFDGDATFAGLTPLVDRLTAVIAVTTHWDESRRALLDRLEGAGTGVRVIVVGQDDAGPAPAALGDRRLRLVSMRELAAAEHSGAGLSL